MRIKKFGLTLSRLRRDDIELVRTMRNREDIRNSMEFRDIISSEQQLKWFHSIDNIYNNYFIIESENRKVGLIHGKNTNFDERSSEGGLFIWDANCIGTPIPMLASVILADLHFYINEFELNYIKVKKDNIRAIRYNEMLGYIHTNALHVSPDFQVLYITKADYFTWSKKYRSYIKLLTGDETILGPESVDFEIYTPEEIERLYLSLPGIWREKMLKYIQLHKNVQ